MSRMILRSSGIIGVIALGLAVLGFSLSLTNEPLLAQPAFVTNTPPPPDVLNTVPDASIDRYALRLWDEQMYRDVLSSQLARLIRGEQAQQNAVRLTLFEMEWRFPGAPHRLEDRERLLNLMLSAPRGSVDLRSVARPYIVNSLNRSGVRTGVASVENFRVEFTALNLNGDANADALIRVVYPSDAETTDQIQYEDFIAIVGNDDGGFTLVQTEPSIPAAPFSDVLHLSLVRSGDLNDDGLDEFALAIDTGHLNKQLGIFGWRNGQIVDLVAPGNTIEYAEIIRWPSETTSLTVANHQVESTRWNCVAEMSITWNYTANFYRPSVALNARHLPLNTIGCALLDAEPVYAQPAIDAITLVQEISNDGTLSLQGADRAGMALAMLYLLDGQTDRAEEQAAALLDLTEDNPWLTSQLDAFTIAASNPSNSGVQVCGELEQDALVRLNDESAAACDVDQVLTQVFTERKIPRSGSLVDSLNALGLPVLERITVSQIGYADRDVVNFAIPGASWWAFAPTDPDYYKVEQAQTPAGYEVVEMPFGPVEPPQAAYDDLLVQGDLGAALTVLDNALLNSGDRPFSIEGQFMQALIYDLLGDRQRARQAYFALWSNATGTTWGQLAGVHLEKR